jgi:autotransporter adhesin
VSSAVYQDNGVAVGNSAIVTQAGGTAIGTNAWANGANAVAIGAGSYAGDADSVSVGSAQTGYTRRIENVTNGVAPSDAATVGQVARYATALGGGSTMLGGVFTTPNYYLNATGAAGTYHNVGSALTALDNGLAAVNARVDNIQLTRGPKGDPGADGPQGVAGMQSPPGPKGDPGTDAVGSATDTAAVHYDDTTKATVMLQGSQGTTIANVRAGLADTDAANVGQITQQVQDALVTARNYTDASAQQTLKNANAYTDWAVSRLNDRIATAEAMETAQAQMVASFAGADPANRNRLAAGVGFAGGHNGVSVGYQHVSEGGHTAWNIGGGVSGQERSVGAGASYSW